MCTIIKSYKEIILLLLYAKGKNNCLYEPIKGRTRLMKMVFLFKEELKKPFNLDSDVNCANLPDFTAYDYGPFSEDVYNDIEFLKINNFINIKELTEETIPEEFYEYKKWIYESNIRFESELYVPEKFEISELGKEFTKKIIINKLNIEQLGILNEFKIRCVEVNMKTLLKYVYEKYPEMTRKSKIKKIVLGNY